MKLLLFVLLFILPQLAVQTFAQEAPKQKAPDAIKLGASFSNSEFGNILSTQYSQGLTAELDARMFRYERFRLGGVFQHNRAQIGADTPLDTYSFGPRLSGDLFHGYVSPFGHALFGFRTTYNQDRAFSRTYGFGVHVNLGHLYLQPFALNYQKVEGCTTPMQRIEVGAGVRF